MLVTPLGDIVLVECKLWRNPQARREVIAQIIDYAKELPRLSYEAFEKAVQAAQPVNREDAGKSLFARVVDPADPQNEAVFIDSVTRNLRRGRFLLLIVGDGIQEGVETLTDFLQQHAGMHFTLGIVEVAIYRHAEFGYLVQPRVLARTTMVERGVVSIADERISVSSPESQNLPGQTTVRVSANISDAGFIEQAERFMPGTAAALQQLMEHVESRGGWNRFSTDSVFLEIELHKRTFRLGAICPKRPEVWFEFTAIDAKNFGNLPAALTYYNSLVSLLPPDADRRKLLDGKSKTGTRALPPEPLLKHVDLWITAMDTFIDTIERSDPG